MRFDRGFLRGPAWFVAWIILGVGWALTGALMIAVISFWPLGWGSAACLYVSMGGWIDIGLSAAKKGFRARRLRAPPQPPMALFEGRGLSVFFACGGFMLGFLTAGGRPESGVALPWFGVVAASPILLRILLSELPAARLRARFAAADPLAKSRPSWTLRDRLPAIARALLFCAFIVALRFALPSIGAIAMRSFPPVHRRPVHTGRFAEEGECEAPALPIAPIELRLGSGAAPYTLEVSVDGEVRHDGKLVARISGACLLDPRGGVLESVGRDRIVKGADGRVVGVIKDQGTLRMDGRVVSVGEVLAKSDESALALSAEGAFLLSWDVMGVVVAQPSGTIGNVVPARRIALLLYDSASFLDE